MGTGLRKVLVSDHALWRWIERFAPGVPLAVATAQVIAAVQDASEMTKQQRQAILKEQFDSERKGKIVYWYDGATNSVLVTERSRDHVYYVITCFPFASGPGGRRTRDTRKHRQRRKAG